MENMATDTVSSSEVESKILACFQDQGRSILQEEKLRSCCESKDLKDASVLCDNLKKLVDSGKLGVRTLTAGETTATVYWLKKQVSASTAPKGVPSGSTVTPGSVRQRSKRSRSSFVSPLIRDSREKRPKLTHTPSAHTDTIKGRLDFDDTCPEADRSSKVTGESTSRGDKDQLLCLQKERNGLLSRLSDRREELRKLKMVKMYRTKNELQGLDELTVKWREVAQDAAQCLLDSSTHQPRPSMQQLLDYLHIEPDLIQYSTEDESFY